MNQVLGSVESVIRKSRNVHINSSAITEFLKSVSNNDFNDSEFQDETILKDASEEQQIAFSVLYNSINFCYWGEPKWTVTIKESKFDGSAGMLRALKTGIESGFPLLDPKYLANIPENDLQNVLSGNVEIPLFRERLQILRDLGKGVQDNFSGTFTTITDNGDNDALKIVEVLVEKLPTIFRDEVNFLGKTVKFYKRAQLVPAHLDDLSKFGLINREISQINQLTAFADYKVPQLLRKFGILEYSDSLANKVDSKIELPSGSEEEIEIRINTIWAVELITRIAKNKFPQATPAKIDGIFWFRGQVKSPDDKPYHRTRTIWY